MTKEEARQIIATWLVSSKGTKEQRGYIEGWFDEEDVEAFRMAIEALNDIERWQTCTPTEAHSYSISICDSCKYIHVPFTHYPCSNCYDYDKYVEWKDQK